LTENTVSDTTNSKLINGGVSEFSINTFYFKHAFVMLC